ncbi:MAG: corrinoid protein [Clostridiales Family XIII bacterium]|jgi:5-methyltetrahydrofolate--homocysteine methyltransferase|nr:corrinoid protein [Clostridiales Family XIII bacterium]
MISLEVVAKLVIDGRGTKVPIACQMLIDAGEAPLDIINGGLIAGMNEVGLRFKADEMFVPEVLASAEAMKAGVEYVMPLINKDDLESEGTVLLGTVKGDLHDIGKNLVGMMLEGAGFTVINAGINVSPEDFVAQIKEHKPDVVAMSALLTTTMLHMKDLVELLKEEGLRDSVKVIVGGAPISQDFADEITADGFSPDAVSATDLCKKLLSAV